MYIFLYTESSRGFLNFSTEKDSVFRVFPHFFRFFFNNVYIYILYNERLMIKEQIYNVCAWESNF